MLMFVMTILVSAMCRLYWADSILYHIRQYDLNDRTLTVFFEQPNVKFYGLSLYKVSSHGRSRLGFFCFVLFLFWVFFRCFLWGFFAWFLVALVVFMLLVGLLVWYRYCCCN